MAETFKNAKANLTTSGATTVYTCPAATTAVVFGVMVANVDGTNAADITISWTDDSDSDTETELCKTVSVPPDAALSVLSSGAKVVLEAGDVLKATASAGNDLKVTTAVLEIT